jgi:hypothetical protein
MTGLRNLSSVICYLSFLVGYSGGAGDWKICGSSWRHSGGARDIALEIPDVVWLVGAPAGRHFRREGQFPILFSARYLHSHQHFSYDSELDFQALNGWTHTCCLAGA